MIYFFLGMLTTIAIVYLYLLVNCLLEKAEQKKLNDTRWGRV